jgi:hypothetical protein
MLERIRLDERHVVGYVPCLTEGCPILLSEAGNTSWTSVDHLRSLQAIKLGARLYLAAVTTWQKAPLWSGTTLRVFEATAKLPVRLEVGLDEFDSRDKAQTLIQNAQITGEADALLVHWKRQRGALTDVNKASQSEDRRYRPGPDGQLAPSSP